MSSRTIPYFNASQLLYSCLNRSINVSCLSRAGVEGEPAVLNSLTSFYGSPSFIFEDIELFEQRLYK